jgi:hypothetical protein
MTVPETTVHKRDRIVLAKNDVRSSGKAASLQAESETCAMQRASYYQLRICIRCSDSRHHPAAGLPINYVCHEPAG